MRNLVIMFLIISFTLISGLHHSEAKRKNYYRTFEIIDISENGLTLRDNDGNIIDVAKDPGDYKVGYKVRYDSVRKRLKNYRWQDYRVTAISDKSIMLQHETGDTISIDGNYSKEFAVGDAVRYDSVGNKLQANEDTTEWKQYVVVAESIDRITIRSNLGDEIVIHMNNNVFPERRGVYIPKYEVGDLVRYDVKNNKLKKAVRRTYDWQEYRVLDVTGQKLILTNETNEILEIENIYGNKFSPGDTVKYDRLNNLLKKYAD